MQILVTLEIATRGESRFTNQLIYVLYLCAYMRADWLIDFNIYLCTPVDSQSIGFRKDEQDPLAAAIFATRTFLSKSTSCPSCWDLVVIIIAKETLYLI